MYIVFYKYLHKHLTKQKIYCICTHIVTLGLVFIIDPVRRKRCVIRATWTRATRTVRPTGRECHWCASVEAPSGNWPPTETAWTPPSRNHRRYAWPVLRPAGTAPVVPSPALAGLRTFGTSGRSWSPIGSRPAACRQSPVRSGTMPKGPVALVPLPGQPWKIRPPGASATSAEPPLPRPHYRRIVQLLAAVGPRASAERSVVVPPTARSIRPSRSRRNRPPTTFGPRSTSVAVDVGTVVAVAVAVAAAVVARTLGCRAGTRAFVATASWRDAGAPLPVPRLRRPYPGYARPTWVTARLCLRRLVGTRTCWPRTRRRAAYLNRPRNRICLSLRLSAFSFRSWTIRPILRTRTCTIRLRCVCTKKSD